MLYITTEATTVASRKTTVVAVKVTLEVALVAAADAVEVAIAVVAVAISAAVVMATLLLLLLLPLLIFTAATSIRPTISLMATIPKQSGTQLQCMQTVNFLGKVSSS